MKQLMIAVAVAFAAFAANAASVNWTSGDIYVGSPIAGSLLDGTDGGTKVANGTTMYYVFSQIDSGDYDTWVTMSQAEKYSAFTADGDSSTVKIGDNSYTVFAAKNVVDGVAGVTETGYQKNDFAYGVCIVTYDANKDGTVDFFTASEATGKCTTSGKDLSGMALMDNDGTATVWSAATATPEPTSGLLLLIGMAGLALRRRRA